MMTDINIDRITEKKKENKLSNKKNKMKWKKIIIRRIKHKRNEQT